MISELENKNLLHKDSKTFNKYFCREEKTPNEIEKQKELSRLVLDFYNKVFNKNIKNICHDLFDYDFGTYDYLDNYGYYVITYDYHNYYYIEHYDDIYGAFVSVARKILTKKSRVYEMKNHKSLKKDFKNRFGDMMYNCFVPMYEYELSKWAIYFDGNIPEEIINRYCEIINHNGDMLTDKKYVKYDVTNQKFILAPKSKTKEKRK